MPPPRCEMCVSADRVNLWPFISVDSQQSIQITARLINDDSDEKMSAEIEKKKKKEGVDWIRTDLIDTNTRQSET